jgi:hypothetical protein
MACRCLTDITIIVQEKAMIKVRSKTYIRLRWHNTDQCVTFVDIIGDDVIFRTFVQPTPITRAVIPLSLPS